MYWGGDRLLGNYPETKYLKLQVGTDTHSWALLNQNLMALNINHKLVKILWR
jgi:hypothetical protein